MAQTSRKVLAAITRWKREHPDKVRQQRARHPTYQRTWRRKNPKKVRAYRMTRGGTP
jgi:hypothetical protein